MKKKNLLVIWLTLVIYLVMGGTALNNSVLCFGEDGHVKIEFVKCANSIAKADHVNTNGIISKDISGDNCGKCTDIPLFTSKIAHHKYLSAYVFNYEKDNTFYFYYPVKLEKIDEKIDKFPLFERISLNYPKSAFQNTSTTVLLN